VEVPRPVLLLEQAAQAQDQVVEGARGERRRRPEHVLDDLAPRHHGAGPGGQQPQQAHLGGRQVGALAAPGARALSAEVDLVAREPQHVAARGGRLVPPEEHADAQQELAQVERLRQVVVGGVLEAADAVLVAAERGEHQHRGVVAPPAHRAEHGQAVGAGQHDVEDHRVDAAALQARERLVAPLHELRAVALEAEIVADHLAERSLVLDDQTPAGHRRRP
jgi:hypothetical protein